ncbi:MAG: hypothetical protein JRJ87_16015 [Deltaproteobacteria bacterium]|nr:hypothetical protein [Deltaproteobacteria bacterium]
MKARISLFVHLAVLLVAATATYFVFSSPEKKTSKGKIILDVEPAELTQLEFLTARKQVEVTPRSNGGFTLKITEQLRKPAPKKATQTASSDGGVPDGASQAADEKIQEPKKKIEPPPMITETTVRSYRASREFEKHLERLLPLYVERDLGKLDADLLTKFQLDKSERSLNISIGKQKVSFTIGSQSYGGATTYILQQPSGPVYLLSSSLQRALDIRWPRYLERRLVELAKKETDLVEVMSLETRQSRKLKRIRLERRDRWVPADEPDAANPLFGNWISKVFRMSTAEYLDQEPVPPPKPVAKLGFIKGSQLSDELVLATTVGANAKLEYYARSNFTGGWVKLKAAEVADVVADLEAVIEKD